MSAPGSTSSNDDWRIEGLLERATATRVPSRPPTKQSEPYPQDETGPPDVPSSLVEDDSKPPICDNVVGGVGGTAPLQAGLLHAYK